MTHPLYAGAASVNWPDTSGSGAAPRPVAAGAVALAWPVALSGRRSERWLTLTLALTLHAAVLAPLALRPSPPLVPPRPLPVTIEFTAAPVEVTPADTIPPEATPPEPTPATDSAPVAPPVDEQALTPPPARTTETAALKTPKPVKPIAKKPLPPRQPAAPAPQSAPVSSATVAPAAAPAAAATVTPPSASAAYLRNPPPAYPDVAINRGWEGTVLLNVQVRPDGKVQTIRLQHSSGYPALDDAAREAVQHWSFVPARRGDQPESGWVVVPVDFTLNS
ncbi:energy transducer TonB [Dickeya dianthicola]|uniref:energy transducer TonB n=1 Tax=Dickeya dianthicola TaxID=204039 RepID=UPI00136CC9BB|nr:energy transducer TonB [Dickeya dianthicola]MCI4237375.1 energy transducer TonB [Dickeya dianthicola]MCI4256005.1 energy transducer TonB [Dickeya dianthicola]MZG21430.1 energy transducer TonB [Dickeya dianthicola]MZI89104.1 energy transducer TonB [Dickeya dianthicola]